MSQQPPPPPHGEPPGSYPPYGGPPGPYPPGSSPPGHGGQPGSGLSNRAKFWIGAVLALPATFVSVFASGVVGTIVVDGLGAGPQAGTIASSIVGLGLLAGLVTLIVLPRTRWVGVGLLAGAAVGLILLAGVCVVFLVALTRSYS